MTAHRSPNTPDPKRMAEDLQPKLRELEQDRLARRKSTFTMAGAMVGVLLAAGGVASITLEMSMLVTLPLFLAVVLTLLLISRRQSAWVDHAGSKLIPEICKAYGDDIEYQKAGDKALVKPFNALELIGYWNRGTVKHVLRGEYGGHRFESGLADLRHHSSGGRKGNSSTRQIFYGFLFRIQLQARIEPGLSIRPNFGWFSKTFGKRAIPTGNEAFDSVFLISVDDDSPLDTDQLNRLLTPDWQQALLDLNEDIGTLPYNQTRLRAGLKYDTLYLALTMEEEGGQVGRVRTQRRRKFPDVGHLLAGESSLEDKLAPMIEDVGAFRRVIDRLPE